MQISSSSRQPVLQNRELHQDSAEREHNTKLSKIW